MVSFLYVFAYVCTIICIGVILYKIKEYLKKPLHVRWELYPVAHEGDQNRAKYGGSYLEDSGWWKHKQHSSLYGAMKGFLIEALFLHCTFEYNKNLWFRTYPFHGGLYFLIGSIFLTVIGALLALAGITETWLPTLIGNLTQVVSFLAFICIIYGSSALIQRRLSDQGLKKYSTREHFLNLGLFLVYGILGLVCWLSSPSFYIYCRDFLMGFFTFSFLPLPSTLFTLFTFLAFFLAAYVPATHMGHFFMKYFLYHDIRWGDEPTQDNPKTQEKIAKVLGSPVSWPADHIKGDGKKNWAEIATTNPTKE